MNNKLGGILLLAAAALLLYKNNIPDGNGPSPNEVMSIVKETWANDLNTKRELIDYCLTKVEGRTEENRGQVDQEINQWIADKMRSSRPTNNEKWNVLVDTALTQDSNEDSISQLKMIQEGLK